MTAYDSESDLLRTSKQKADDLKRKIVQKISEMLGMWTILGGLIAHRQRYIF